MLLPALISRYSAYVVLSESKPVLQKEVASVGRVAYSTAAAVETRVQRISDGRTAGLQLVEIVLTACHQNRLTSQLIAHDTISV